MYMGNFDSSRMLTDVRRLCGQFSTGPTAVACQSRSRMNLPIVPPPERQLASLEVCMDPWLALIPSLFHRGIVPILPDRNSVPAFYRARAWAPATASRGDNRAERSRVQWSANSVSNTGSGTTGVAPALLTTADIAVNDAAAVHAQVDAPVHTGIASNDNRIPVLVLVIVDTHPGGTTVIGTEDLCGQAPVLNAEQINRRVAVARRRFPEPERIRPH